MSRDQPEATPGLKRRIFPRGPWVQWGPNPPQKGASLPELATPSPSGCPKETATRPNL